MGSRSARGALVLVLVLAAVAVYAVSEHRLVDGAAYLAVVLGAAVAAWVVGFGAIPVFCTAACLRARSLTPDLSSAVNNAASNVGIGLGAAVGGAVLAGAGLPSVIVLAAAAFAVAAILVLALRSAFPVRVAQG